eukprot:1431458-Prymnesium_polylepis.1
MQYRITAPHSLTRVGSRCYRVGSQRCVRCGWHKLQFELDPIRGVAGWDDLMAAGGGMQSDQAGWARSSQLSRM